MTAASLHPAETLPLETSSQQHLSFALMVTGSSTSQSHHSALNFTRAALGAGHRVLRVFFFSDGVTAGDAQRVPAPDTTAIASQWATLAAEHAIDLVICATSAVRRGVLDTGEAQRHDRAVTLQAGFEISGLGQWVEACLLADRAISFG